MNCTYTVIGGANPKARRDCILDIVYDFQNEYGAGILTEDEVEEEL